MQRKHTDTANLPLGKPLLVQHRTVRVRALW